MESTTTESYWTLRLMCGNAVGMAAFVFAFLIAEEIGIALAAGVLVGVIGYVASSAVVEYATAERS
ncbi:hypothetical protein [Halorubrum sp. DTA98]|uniref:hypothetical protein n=1 Tax=Halorubrum sp. DTA98 TaxID=3402163 RepID=UPI003AAA3F98